MKSLAELVEALPAPRVVWVMVPAGEPTAATIAELGELLAVADLVIDGGNSNYRDSIAHADELAGKGIGFVDAGVSGGVWGLENGYGLMVGGSDEHIALIRPVLEALAPEGGLVHAGPVGAGHFTKMVHNGIEYGLMQSYAEGLELLRASELGIDVPGAVKAWRQGTVIRSWLLDLLDRALDDDPGLEAAQGLGRGLRRGSLDGPGSGPAGRAGPGHLRRPVRPLRLPPGRVAGHEGDRRPPPAVRRARRPPMSTRPRADALVLFGITGDLAYKKLFPALYHLAARRVLDGRPIIGVASSELSDDDIRQRARDSVAAAGITDVDQAALTPARRCARLRRAATTRTRRPSSAWPSA